MLHCNDFILSFMERYRYPEIAVTEFTRLEKRLDRAEAHGRALERVVKHIVGDASKRAFEFAVEQYGWHELHEMNERAMREAFRGGQEPAR